MPAVTSRCMIERSVWRRIRVDLEDTPEAPGGYGRMLATNWDSCDSCAMPPMHVEILAGNHSAKESAPSSLSSVAESCKAVDFPWAVHDTRHTRFPFPLSYTTQSLLAKAYR